MSKKVNQPNSGITKSDLKNAVKLAPNDVYADQVRGTSYHAPSELGESMVVLVVPASGFPEQFTIHRPIGVHDLRPDDWVMTRSSDVHYLMARKKNPNASLIAQQQMRNRTAYLVGQGILIKEGEVVFYSHEKARPRNEILSEADEKLAKAKKAGTAGPLAKRDDYLDPQARQVEYAIREVFNTPEGMKARDEGVDLSFRTRGGILEDEEQHAIPGFRGKTLRDLQVTVNRAILEGIGLGKNLNVTQVVNVRGGVLPPGANWADEEQGHDPGLARDLAVYESCMRTIADTTIEINKKIEQALALVDKVGDPKTNPDVLRNTLKQCLTEATTGANSVYTAATAPGGPL